MRIVNLFRPKPTLSDQEIAHGTRMMVWEGAFSTAMFSVVTSGLLAAYGLALGANSLQIGILLALPYLTQLVQIPAVVLVERFRWRKAIASVVFFFAQLMWLVMAAIPIFVGAPSRLAISLLLILLIFRGILSAISTCAWNGWIKDLIPSDALGKVFSQRMLWGTIATIIFGLGGAIFVDVWQRNTTGKDELLGYSMVFALGAVTIGIAAPLFQLFTPERQMQAVPPGQPSILRIITAPLKDKNFRQLAKFLFLFQTITYLAIPFFAVYMLERLNYSLSLVIGLYLVSQVSNMYSAGLWGRLVDRFDAKSVLSLSGSLYLLVILGWTFTTMPERYVLTLPLLVLLHILAGSAQAGVSISVQTIGLRLAPVASATAYLAGVSLATNVGAGIGPLLGGAFAHYFAVRELSFEFKWADPSRVFDLPVVHLTGFDFLFAVAFLLGLVTLRFLAQVQEKVEADQKLVLDELMAQSRGVSRLVSAIPGIRLMGLFPNAYLRQVPGFEVAMGVMAYQLAAYTKAAASVASRGHLTVKEVADKVTQTVSEAAKQLEELGEEGVSLARHATRGTIQGIGDLTEDVGQFTRGGVAGVIRAMGRTQGDIWEAIWGAGYGAIEGAHETGAELKEVAVSAVESAKEVAREMGLPENKTAAKAAQGALAAAETLGEDAVAQVKEAVSEALPSETSGEQGQRPDTRDEDVEPERP